MSWPCTKEEGQKNAFKEGGGDMWYTIQRKTENEMSELPEV